MRRMLFVCLFIAGSCLVQVGCKHCGSCPNHQAQPGPIGGPGPGPTPLPPGAAWLPEAPIAPAPVGPQSSNLNSSALPRDTAWRSGIGPSVRLYPPEVEENPDAGKKTTTLYPPDHAGIN